MDPIKASLSHVPASHLGDRWRKPEERLMPRYEPCKVCGGIDEHADTCTLEDSWTDEAARGAEGEC